jgi:arylsulfatase A-like enzyme
VKPNIIYILTDNLGYGELGCYGGGELRGAPTPRADQLAAEGLRLTNFNVEAQCTPSRSAILTGRYAYRSGTLTVPIGNPELADPSAQGLTQWEITLPKLLSGVGYRTAHFGKWHLGSIDGRLPNDQGFDEWWAFRGRQTKSSGRVIRALQHPEFAGRTGNGDFADSVVETDHRLGKILDAIDELGVRDNTIVVFTSDNGPDPTWPWQGSSGPWRGYYFTHMEGSLRVPFLVRWPGKIPPGRVSNEIVHQVDTFTTLAGMAGVPVPTDRAIDGVDQTDFLTGHQQKSNRESILAFVADRLEAVKWRNWKLVFYEETRGLVRHAGEAHTAKALQSDH